MYCVYILNSLTYPEKYYVGFTTDLGKRVAIHNQGGCPHTAKCLPWKVKTHLTVRE